MKNAYINISDWYKTNGKKDLYDEINDNNDEKVKQDKSNENEEINKNKNIINKENNLINKRFLISYYYNFCDILKTLDFSKIFITMTLPKTIKGFTFRFLKIILNYNGIELYTNNKFDTNELLKAYLIFVIIHEINHFIKRYFNKDIAYDLCRTPKINELDEGEGGKQLIKLLFGDPLINNYLNEQQAKYMLNRDNWNNKTLKQFKTDFEKISKNTDNKSSIIFLNSYNMLMCDHSKLSI